MRNNPEVYDVMLDAISEVQQEILSAKTKMSDVDDPDRLMRETLSEIGTIVGVALRDVPNSNGEILHPTGKYPKKKINEPV